MNRLASRIIVLRLIGVLLALLAGGQLWAMPVSPETRNAPRAVRDFVLPAAGARKTRAGEREVGMLYQQKQGTVRLIAIPVQFKADTDAATSGTGQFPYRTWGPTQSTDTATYLRDRLNALTDYYRETSGGRITLTCTLGSIVTLEKTMPEYVADDAAGGTAFETETFTAADLTIDFSLYDVILIIHAGVGREVALDYANSREFHSHTSSANYLSNDGVILNGYALVPESFCHDSYFKLANPTIDIATYEKNPTGTVFNPHYWDVLGVWAHEMGHVFGMPDLYDTSDTDAGLSLGDWSLMAEGGYLPWRETTDPPMHQIPHNPARPYFGSVPAGLDAYCKQLVGWTNVINVTAPRIHERILPSSTAGSAVYRMWRDSDSTSREYFLIENRARVGYDRYLPEAGLMIYHIDETIGSWDLYSQTDRANNLQWNPLHPRVFPESADNILEGTGTVRPVVNTAFPGTLGNTHVGNTTTPSSMDYSGLTTDVDVDNIEVAGNDVYADLRTYNFKITIVSPPPGAVLYVTRPTLVATTAGLSGSTLSVTVDGVTAGTPTVSANGELTFRLTLNTEKVYTVAIVGQDAFGGPVNVSTSFTYRKRYLQPGKTAGSTPGGRSMMFAIPAIEVGTFDQVIQDIRPLLIAAWNPQLALYHRYWDASLELNAETNAATDRVTNVKMPPAGRAFWISGLTQDVELKLDGDILRQYKQYVVPVRNGFNMIGNPYLFPVTYNSLLIEYNGQVYTFQEATTLRLIDPVIYWWDPAIGYRFTMAPEATLQPWQGYWMLVRASTATAPLNLIFQPVAAGSVKSAGASTAKSGAGWEVMLHATANGGTKTSVTVGALAGASNLADFGIDVTAPPAFPDMPALNVRSAQSGERLLRDYRAPAPGAMHQWNLTVGGPAGSTVQLSWPNLRELPKDYLLTLRDEVTGNEVYLRTSRGYQVKLGAQEQERQLTLIAAPGMPGSLRVTNLQVVQARSQGTATLTCQVTKAANVTMEVRSMSGRLIKRYPAASAAQGLVTLTWDGMDSRGRRVPRGAYLCHVLAETPAGQKATAVTILPF